jgi:hypothetical protein
MAQLATLGAYLAHVVMSFEIPYRSTFGSQVLLFEVLDNLKDCLFVRRIRMGISKVQRNRPVAGDGDVVVQRPGGGDWNCGTDTCVNLDLISPIF